MAVGPAASGPGGGRKATIRRRLLAPLQSERKPARAAKTKIAQSVAEPATETPSSIDADRRTAETTAMRIALYEPDIPQNTGTILRLAACLGIDAHIVGPAGFPTSDRAFRRAGMDYLDQVSIMRHTGWDAFEAWRREDGARLILFTTAGAVPYLDRVYRPDDILMFGRESAGVPEAVHQAADARLVIPMRPGLRSINVAMAAAMALGEAIRQTGGFVHE